MRKSQLVLRQDDLVNITDETILSSHQIAKLLQSSPSAILSWFDQGMLEGFRTPGGHRRVKVKELRHFLQSHKIPVPLALTHGIPAPYAIYIIDDEEVVHRLMHRDFAKLDCAVDIQGSTQGVEALLAIGANPPDLIFLDVYMQEMNGFEVCRQLRSAPQLKDVVIVAMSAHPSDKDREKILECGAQAYLTKPISASQLLELIPSAYRNKKTDAA